MSANFGRLERMANLVEREVERGYYDFDLKEWGCGTTACAIGMAIATDEFKAEGLVAHHRRSPIYLSPEKLYLYPWDAISAFFVIDLNTAWFFFSAHTYPANLRSGPDSAREVVRRIRAFINVESDLRTINEIILDPRSILEIRAAEKELI